ncbi:hypothetical protein SGPA1_11987 [Streptomyces misionensis JCM 4497]
MTTSAGGRASGTTRSTSIHDSPTSSGRSLVRESFRYRDLIATLRVPSRTTGSEYQPPSLSRCRFARC